MAEHELLLQNHTPDLNIYRSSTPKDCLDGINGLCTNISVGVFGGLGLLLTAPICGLIAGGTANGVCGSLAGLGVGIGVGVFGSVGLVAGGIVFGLDQFIRL